MVFENNKSATSYEIELGNIHSLRTNQSHEYLSYKKEDIILARAITESSTDNDDILLTSKPNPTAGETVIEYSLETDSYVSIKLYSMSGQLIQTISEAEKTAGTHSLNFNGSTL
jgi:hypothetical protein